MVALSDKWNHELSYNSIVSQCSYVSSYIYTQVTTHGMATHLLHDTGFAFTLHVSAYSVLLELCCQIQCCWNMVTRSPNATHESTGRPKVLPLMVRLATNGFFKFCRKCFGMKVERVRRFHRCTDIKCLLCLGKMRTLCGPFWPFFDWLHAWSQQITDWRTTQNWDGPPNDQP